MEIIDTHAHLFDEAFAGDLDEVVARAKECHIEKVFLPNIDESTVPGMLSLCGRWPGLDYYWDRTYYKEQQDAFRRQVEWSLAYGLPLMIHSRSAHEELLEVLSSYKKEGINGVFHSFGGTAEEAADLLSFEGFMIGINGVLTFKKSSLPDVLRTIPLCRVVLETDSPYLAPVPFRGKRNESAYVCRTLERMAEVYGLPVEEVARQTRENALRIYPKAAK